MMVPLRPILDERDPFAFVRVRDDAVRLAGLERQRPERLDERGVVVAIHLAHRPAERPHLVGQRLQPDRPLRGVPLLQAVAIHDPGQVVQPEVRRGHRRLPVAALLELAVAGEDEGAPSRIIHLRAQRRAHRHRQPVTERAGARLDAG